MGLTVITRYDKIHPSLQKCHQASTPAFNNSKYSQSLVRENELFGTLRRTYDFLFSVSNCDTVAVKYVKTVIDICEGTLSSHIRVAGTVF